MCCTCIVYINHTAHDRHFPTRGLFNFSLFFAIMYITPTDEIIQRRCEFYGLWRRCDDETGAWLNRIENLIDRCEFPPFLNREYLLIDKFVCELNTNAREFIQSENTWTLTKLKEYFFDQKIVANSRVNVNISIDGTFDHPTQQLPLSSSVFSVNRELVSNSKYFICVELSSSSLFMSSICTITGRRCIFAKCQQQL